MPKGSKKKSPRKNKLETSVIKEKKSIVAESKISLAQWFSGKLSEGKVKTWQYDTIKLYFTKQGLKEYETTDAYNKMFEKF